MFRSGMLNTYLVMPMLQFQDNRPAGTQYVSLIQRKFWNHKFRSYDICISYDHFRCWIKFAENGFKLILYFIPFFIFWIFNFVVYIRVTRELGKITSSSIRTTAESKIRLYLLVFMLCIGIGAANRMQNWANPSAPQFWLYCLDALVSPLQGFLNRHVKHSVKIPFICFRKRLVVS